MLRMTMFFETDNYTWTESHWLPGPTNYTDGVQPVKNIAEMRNQLLAEDCFMVAVRLTNPSLPRTSYYLTQQDLPGISSIFQKPGPNQTEADRPYSAVLVTYTGADGSEANGFVSGAPDNIIGQGNLATRGMLPLGLWGGKWDSYAGTPGAGNIGVLGFNGAAYRALDYSAPAAQPILAFGTNANAAGQISIRVGAQLTFTLSPPVIMLKGIRKENPRAPGLSGQYYVNLDPNLFPVAAPWTYLLEGTENVNISNLVKARGVVAALKYKYPIIQSGQVIGATHRKRGGRMLLPAGKSKTRT